MFLLSTLVPMVAPAALRVVLAVSKSASGWPMHY